MFIQGIQAQQCKLDTMVNNVDLRLEKLQCNVYNGVITSVFGALIGGIGYATYKDASRFEKNTLDYKLYKTHFDNKVKLGKSMMIGGGVLVLVGGGITITAQKKIKINLLCRNICLSLH